MTNKIRLFRKTNKTNIQLNEKKVNVSGNISTHNY